MLLSDIFVHRAQRSSTTQGKDNIDKTTRTVIDTVQEADDKRLTRLDQWSWCGDQHTRDLSYLSLASFTLVVPPLFLLFSPLAVAFLMLSTSNVSKKKF